MNPNSPFEDVLRGTKILRAPKHRLATFGSTTLTYVLLSPLEAHGQCRIREGEVSARRPHILTAEQWRERFEGFGDNTRAFQEAIEHMYGEAFRGVEYTFRNELRQSSIEPVALDVAAERIAQTMDADGAPLKALLQGPDHHWSFCIMKFIMEMSLRSFPANVKELDERGLFDPQGRALERRKREVETLFRDARRQPEKIRTLGQRLKDWGLFEAYEDRFFSLVNPR